MSCVGGTSTRSRVFPITRPYSTREENAVTLVRNKPHKPYKKYLPGIPSEQRGRPQYTRSQLIVHMNELVKQLGHFPTADEYQRHPENRKGCGAYQAMGHITLARACGFRRIRLSVPDRSNKFLWRYIKIGKLVREFQPQTTTYPYECFNGTYCIARPINRVKRKHEYCEPCKKDRGWYD